ncbi:c-type cytochrome [Ruegeria marina]|uniref:Cytochrome C oxidase, cbb3-type, subunit III n=1 Tax=Ruegeria marina TaxID=639004 RepID=A0A1G6VWT5_9RHOB|nr:cytochrome c [Ruegeria marina]SDD57974.1 Cytochrome C oxidase, cbb3-type, subunit III [Ruegeria marina]
MKIKQFCALAALLGSAASAPAWADPVERGAYLVRIMDCAGCHMPRGPEGAPIASAGLSGGNIGFEIPGLGIFWAPNLTPSQSGLGSWSDDEIATALRSGIRPDGRILAPAMPWQAYAGLSDEDTHAVVVYLRSLPAQEGAMLQPVGTAQEAEAPFYRVVLP